MAAPTYRSPSNSQIQIGNENGLNTMFGTPVGHVLRKASFAGWGYHTKIQDDGIYEDPNPRPSGKGLQVVTARLTASLSTEEFGLLCYFFFGSYSVSGASAPYTHTFKISTTDPVSVWLEVGDTALGKYDLFNGLYISGLSISPISKESGLIKVTVDFVASGKFTRNGGSSQDASPDTYDDDFHKLHLATVEVDTVLTTVITGISWGVTRTISMQGVLDGTPYKTDGTLHKYMYTCTVSGWRDTTDSIFALDDDAEHVLELISPRPGDATRDINIKHGEAYFLNTQDGGEVSGDSPIPATVEVDPFYVDGSDASSVVVTVKTEVADYSALMAS